MTRPIRASESDGTTWDAPTDEQLHDLVADLNLRHRFLIVQRLDSPDPRQHYIQVYLEDDLSHTIEYREGGTDAHYTARIPRDPSPWAAEPVARVITSWAAGDATWRHALPWQPVVF
ncbi:hypothetical protein E1265_06700 [Streptomyces sp. 8K308]|uniref:hypothetical protein n=1 Tax=Streptomyces sp. 8K308 TaxID=2530388 RepID=UPI00104CAA28|nr:hypothetical protein [Streptomyces sp. 8K308]TDC25554.1 hypothetical protein E1265_06700 [Streptomyces sp. 8K308]